LKAEIDKDMRVITTAISGSGEKGYLDRFSKFAETKGKKVKIYNPGEMLFEHAARRGVRMPRDKVLKTNPHTLDERRSTVFERILSDVEKPANRGSSFIINMHGSFYWNFSYEPGIDFHYLNEFDPDLYVNFLNDVDTVENNLKDRKQWNFLFSPERTKNYGRNKILDWQSVEVLLTRLLAQRDPKRWAQSDPQKFFVIPTKATETMLYRFMFEPWRKVFYVGMPLTLFHDPKFAGARKRIDELIKWTEYWITVTDPRYVEPLDTKLLTQVDPAMYHSVVKRDLYWLIPQCDGMIAYFPDASEAPYSAGEDIEFKEVSDTCGETLLIYPSGKSLSPFLFVWGDKILRSDKQFKREFLSYLGKKYVNRVRQLYKK